MSVRPEHVIEAARMRGRPIPEPTVQQAQQALATVDVNALVAEEESKLVYEVWDKKSPINGVPAEYFLNRFDVDPSSEIYIVKDAETGNVVYFQPHEPEVAGHVRMTKATVHAVAQNHRRKIATERANARAIEQALKSLGV